MIAKEMGLPWRAVEAMHWQMGCEDMASRANVPVFQPHVSSAAKPSSVSMPMKRKSSRSPPSVLDGTIGGGITRTRRSSSAASRRRADSKAEKLGAMHLPALEESGGGPDSGGGESVTGGSVSGRDWGDRETSHARSGSYSSSKSPASGDVHMLEHSREV